jgi:hypothetical protein
VVAVPDGPDEPSEVLPAVGVGILSGTRGDIYLGFLGDVFPRNALFEFVL